MIISIVQIRCIPRLTEYNDKHRSMFFHGIAMFVALISAIIGGLLLNLMPCVLPILSIKVISVAKIGNLSRANAMKASLSYAAGISLCMFCFSSLLIILRNLGFSVGWGYQMHSPTFIAAMVYLVFMLGLSMSGLFDFPSISTKKPPSSNSLVHENFFAGLYCVLLATPCFAPFMGSAVSFALLQDSFIAAFVVFQGLAVGLALPYVLISMLPQLVRMVPKPGKWMNTFKVLLAFPMYVTSAWLVWVLAKLGGSDSVLLVLIGLILASFSLTLWQSIKHRTGFIKPVSFVVLLLISILPVMKISQMEFAGHENPNSEYSDGISFSECLIQDLKNQNKTFMVVAGADWCLTCKINEQFLEQKDVKTMLDQHHVMVMKADWTKMDKSITNYMKQFNSAGVPLYVMYVNGKEPKQLPQILTKDALIKALK